MYTSRCWTVYSLYFVCTITIPVYVSHLLNSFAILLYFSCDDIGKLIYVCFLAVSSMCVLLQITYVHSFISLCKSGSVT